MINNITVIVKCSACSRNMVLHGQKQLKDRSDFGCMCDKCLTELYEREMSGIEQEFKNIN